MAYLQKKGNMPQKEKDEVIAEVKAIDDARTYQDCLMLTNNAATMKKTTRVLLLHKLSSLYNNASISGKEKSKRISEM